MRWYWWLLIVVVALALGVGAWALGLLSWLGGKLAGTSTAGLLTTHEDVGTGAGVGSEDGQGFRPTGGAGVGRYES